MSNQEERRDLVIRSVVGLLAGILAGAAVGAASALPYLLR